MRATCRCTSYCWRCYRDTERGERKKMFHRHTDSLFTFPAGSLSRPADFIRMQIRGRAPGPTQYPGTMAKLGPAFADSTVASSAGKKSRRRRNGRRNGNPYFERCVQCARAKKRASRPREREKRAVDYFAPGITQTSLTLGLVSCRNASGVIGEGEEKIRRFLRRFYVRPRNIYWHEIRENIFYSGL